MVLNSLDDRYGSTYRIRALASLLEKDGHAVNYVEGRGGILRRWGMILRSALDPYDLLFIQKFNPLTLSAHLIGLIRKKGVIADWDDLDAGLQGGQIRRLLAILSEWLGPRLPCEITTHNSEISDRIRKVRKKPHFVHQGFDSELFHPNSLRRLTDRNRFGFTPSDLVVGHLCTFTFGGTLDLPVILDAWAKILDPNIRFLLIGGGPQEHKVRELLALRNLSHRVTLTGLLPHGEIPSVLNALDLGVVFMRDSPGNRARVSFKVIEYLAMGIPVVGHVVGETRSLFGGHVIEANELQLAATIEKILHFPPSPLPMNLLQKFDWNEALPPLREAVTCAMKGVQPCP